MTTETTKDQPAKGTKTTASTREDGLPEPTDEDLSFGKADPADPTLNSYDIDYQAAPARGDLNTTDEQGEPVNPDGFPQDIVDVQEARRERNAKNVKAKTDRKS